MSRVPFEVADRHLRALEAVTGELRGVIDLAEASGTSEYARGYVAGQQALARRIAEQITREMG